MNEFEKKYQEYNLKRRIWDYAKMDYYKSEYEAFKRKLKLNSAEKKTKTCENNIDSQQTPTS